MNRFASSMMLPLPFRGNKKGTTNHHQHIERINDNSSPAEEFLLDDLCDIRLSPSSQRKFIGDSKGQEIPESPTSVATSLLKAPRLNDYDAVDETAATEDFSSSSSCSACFWTEAHAPSSLTVQEVKRSSSSQRHAAWMKRMTKRYVLRLKLLDAVESLDRVLAKFQLLKEKLARLQEEDGEEEEFASERDSEVQESSLDTVREEEGDD